MCTCTCMQVEMYGDSSPSSMWVPVTELRSSGLAVNDFTHWAFLLALRACCGFWASTDLDSLTKATWLLPQATLGWHRGWSPASWIQSLLSSTFSLSFPLSQSLKLLVGWSFDEPESLKAGAQGHTFDWTEHPLESSPSGTSHVNYFFLGQAYGNFMVFFPPFPYFFLIYCSWNLIFRG